MTDIKIEGMPMFISCVKKLQEMYNIKLIKVVKNEKEFYEGSNDRITIIAKPKIEKGRIMINIDGKRLCEINTYEKYVRLAVPINSIYLNDGNVLKKHKKKKFDSYEEFYNFLQEWIANIK